MNILIIPRLLGALIICYTILISLRILLSWFGHVVDLRAFSLLSKLTDPYLSLFRGFRFLHTRQFDYSPLLGIGILIILSQILLMIADTGIISLAAILAIILTTVFSSLFWIVLFFVILCVIRYIALTWNKALGHPIWVSIDSLLHSVLLPVYKFFPHKTEYRKMLGAAILIYLALLGAGYVIVNLLIFAVLHIPF